MLSPDTQLLKLLITAHQVQDHMTPPYGMTKVDLRHQHSNRTQQEKSIITFLHQQANTINFLQKLIVYYQ